VRQGQESRFLLVTAATIHAKNFMIFMTDKWPHHWTMKPNLEYIGQWSGEMDQGPKAGMVMQ